MKTSMVVIHLGATKVKPDGELDGEDKLGQGAPNASSNWIWLGLWWEMA